MGSSKKLLLFPLFAAVLIVCFAFLVEHLAEDHRDERKTQIEEACRFAAVACYAAEGFYPPDLDYLAEHYAFSAAQAAEDDFAVFYQPIADNLMPDITVVDLHE